MTGRWAFVLGTVAAIGIGFFLRLPGLNERPMHADEAVHAFKLDDLWQRGEYIYDPHDFHGPTLYYATLPILWLSGTKDISGTAKSTYRIVPVIFGLSLIALTAGLAPAIGRGESVCAALLAAISTALTYYSRYYIQESLLLFFTLALIIAGYRFIVTKSWRWAMVVGMSVGFMYATKETSLISFAAMAAAIWLTCIVHRCSQTALILTDQKPAQTQDTVSQHRMLLKVGMILIVATSVSVCCYSVLFTRIEGAIDSLDSVFTYTQRATEGIHSHPWYFHLRTLYWTHYAPAPVFTEAMILLFALVGVFLAYVKRNRISHKSKCAVSNDVLRLRFTTFIALYALFSWIAYAVIPYKTPWCAIQFHYPLIVLAGIASWRLVAFSKTLWVRLAIIVVMLLAASDLVVQNRLASSRFSADARNPYAYAHTLRSIEDLWLFLEQLSESHLMGDQMPIAVYCEDSWPLPWYTRRLKGAHYKTLDTLQQEVHEPVAVFIIDGSITDIQLEKLALQPNMVSSSYGLRPGKQLAVFVDEQLWENFANRSNQSHN